MRKDAGYKRVQAMLTEQMSKPATIEGIMAIKNAKVRDRFLSMYRSIVDSSAPMDHIGVRLFMLGCGIAKYKKKEA